MMSGAQKVEHKDDIVYSTRVDAVDILGPHDAEIADEKNAATAENAGLKSEQTALSLRRSASQSRAQRCSEGSTAGTSLSSASAGGLGSGSSSARVPLLQRAAR